MGEEAEQEALMECHSAEETSQKARTVRFRIRRREALSNFVALLRPSTAREDHFCDHGPRHTANLPIGAF